MRERERERERERDVRGKRVDIQNMINRSPF